LISILKNMVAIKGLKDFNAPWEDKP
jgi:hypothetical protein